LVQILPQKEGVCNFRNIQRFGSHSPRNWETIKPALAGLQSLKEVINIHTLAVRIYCNSVKWSEVSSHTANFLLENLVVEAGFEFPLARRSCGDVHCCLTTSKNNKVLFRSDGSTVKWSIGYIGFHDFKISCIDELLPSACFTLVSNIEPPTLAVLSFEAVMKYVLSDDHCISVTWRS